MVPPLVVIGRVVAAAVVEERGIRARVKAVAGLPTNLETAWAMVVGAVPSGFGDRLRFIAYRLDLDEKQVAALARILDELKTERAQAEVDRRRTVAALADAVAGEIFDAAKAAEGAKLRVTSAERLRDAVVRALQQIHAMLDGEQRAKLAYLIRTGTLLI